MLEMAECYIVCTVFRMLIIFGFKLKNVYVVITQTRVLDKLKNSGSVKLLMFMQEGT